MTQAVRIGQLCFQSFVSEDFAMYLTLPQQMPFAVDRSFVLYMEMHDSSSQNGATGMTIGRSWGFEGKFGAYLTWREIWGL